MKNFEYVVKREYMPIKNSLIDLIKKVQDEVRNYFTFRFDFIGSASRNMITRDIKSNIGYDFDVNIQVNDPKEHFSPNEIKSILIEAFDKYNHLFKYDFCEDSKRVITIKVKDRINSKIIHSCDFAIVNNCDDGRQQYIHFDKKKQTYEWQFQPENFYRIDEAIQFIKKDSILFNEFKELYLRNKNNNEDPNKKSRSILAETISQICKF